LGILTRIKESFKGETEGPYKAERIMNTPEIKVVQVFSKLEKDPIVLIVSTIE
jgi:hypothetical protein